MNVKFDNIKKLLFLLFALLFCSVYAQDDIEVINIENPAVQAYMHDSTYYSNSDYRTSIVYNYYNKDLYGNNLDWPAGKLVEWTPTSTIDNIAEIRISVSENEDFSETSTHTPSAKDATSYVIRNMMPNLIYYYKVEEVLYNGQINILTSGKFRTIGQVRMIQVLGSHNVRDMGGWVTQYDVPIRYGILYRSASLDAITSQGIHDFADNLHVGAELDLRAESRLKYSRLGADKDFLLLAHDAGTKGLINNKHLYLQDMRWIIERLRQGKNVDWHCAIGCDRCGTLSFLIGGLLGMTEIDLSRDFELSTFSNRKRPRAHISSWLSYIRKYGPADNLALCFYNYWLEVGLTENEIDFLLSVMLYM